MSITTPKEKEAAELDADVVVVGAGFAGLYALHRLRDRLSLRVRVFERGDGVGGTWYWNRYPGARCDSLSMVYCYSFSPELDREWTWSSKYPEQPEILSYLEYVAERFDLLRDIELSTAVTSAHFDDASSTWSVETDRGERVRARYLVSAVGCLSAANLPDIPGRDSFEGEAHHTGAWPHEGVSFAGKRVGLIGTGSTGIQMTPVVAAEARQLTVFQRTPNFTVPTQNKPLSRDEIDAIKRDYPQIRELACRNWGGHPYEAIQRNTFDVSDEERQRIFEELWQEGGFRFQLGSFRDVMIDRKANHEAAEFIRSKIRQIVRDPETAEKLCPYDHPYGSKRPPIDTDYLVTFNRDNVSLVDIREDPIEHIEPRGIRTKSGLHELDVIVFATGFDAMTGSLLRMDIRGSGGLPLAEKWSAGPRTYLGLQVAGFPNLFVITGPGSPSVLMNVPAAIEQHVEWISDCIEHMRKQGHQCIEAEREAEEAWVDQGNRLAERTLFYDARSWYLGVNVPGKPRVFMPYAGGQVRYRREIAGVAERGYEGFRFDGEGLTRGADRT